MGDHFNDYPQTVGSSSPSYQTVIMDDKKRQKEEFAVKMAPFYLWKWAEYLIEDEYDLPCKFGADYKSFLPQLEAIVRQGFPDAHVGRWEVIKDTSLDLVFKHLGLAPIPVQEWEKR